MRVAALADIHGNVNALAAVLADPRCAEADAIVVLGDAIAGPFPAETFDALARLGDRVHALIGNADRLVLDEETEVSRWRREQLGPERTSVVRGWPQSFALDIDGLGAVRFCHAVPRSDEEIVTPLTPEPDFVAALAGTVERVVAGGHLHIHFDRRVGGHRFVNVGSVGWPYEGRPGAYWALLGPDVRFVRSDYDVEAAAEAIRASAHPGGTERLHELLDPPGPDELARRFEAFRAA